MGSHKGFYRPTFFSPDGLEGTRWTPWMGSGTEPRPQTFKVIWDSTPQPKIFRVISDSFLAIGWKFADYRTAIRQSPYPSLDILNISARIFPPTSVGPYRGLASSQLPPLLWLHQWTWAQTCTFQHKKLLLLMFWMFLRMRWLIISKSQRILNRRCGKVCYSPLLVSVRWRQQWPSSDKFCDQKTPWFLWVKRVPK